MSVYDLSFFIPGLPFDGETIKKASLGGSETAAYYLAHNLTKRGHNVVIFCNAEAAKLVDGTWYRPLQEWGPYAMNTQHDVQVVQRLPAQFAVPLASRFNILWQHDLASARDSSAFRSVLWNVDRVACVSMFHVKQLADTHGLPARLMWQTRNGIDPALFGPASRRPRKRKRLIYGARPERGLDVLLEHVWPKILAAEPEAELRLHSYANNPPGLENFYRHIAALARPYGDKIRMMPPLPKDRLAEAYSKAGVYIYPTPSPHADNFREVSCISVMEAQAAGLPVVCSDGGALPETLREGAGVLIGGNPWEPDTAQKFVDAALAFMRDDDLFEHASAAGRAAAPSLDWALVAAAWEAEIDRLFALNNADPLRLARHFYRRSDVVLAHDALDRAADRVAMMHEYAPGLEVERYGAAVNKLRAEIVEKYAFARDDESLKAHYVKYGEATDARLSGATLTGETFDNTQESRFKNIAQWFSDKPHLSNVVDFGCGHGWMDIFLARRFPNLRITGVDVDPGAVKWSREFADRFAPHPEKLAFHEGDSTMEPPAGAPFDVLVCSEVLEHLREPWAALERIERWVRPGGRIVLTVPYGPTEYATPNWTTSFRNHLWDFDRNDLREVFGQKSEMEVFGAFDHVNERTREACGYHVVIYTADQKPLGRVNWERKLTQQRPRHTIGAAIMAGGESVEETLHWCLRSVQWVCDEIVIADCGMTDEARRIASQYPVEIIRCESPRVIGFEGPRNFALDRLTTDFCLWIDTDEKLTDPGAIYKYARSSIFDAYGIRQHHFACDAAWTPDMPSRLFRRAPNEQGARMRFYGMIHEHPEFGLNKGPGEIVILADVHIAHVGYLVESTRRLRFDRNHPLLRADMTKYPERMLQKYFVMRDNIILANKLIQANGGALTDDVRMLCDEVIKLHRQHFLGKCPLANIEPHAHYSDALRILGIGVDVSMDLKARRDNAGDQLNGGQLMRFADIDEAKAEIGHRLSVKLTPLMRPNW